MANVITNAKVVKNIYVHNDLENAALYFKQRVKERAEKDDRNGIGHEMMACLVMLAFTVEAQFNFLGFKLKGREWDEGSPALKKVQTVLEHLKVGNDLGKRPYKTIVDLKKLRDMLAHGTPKEINKKEENWRASEEELRKEGALNADYEALIKDEFVFQAYDDVDAIWKDLLERAEIDFLETITAGGVEYTITYQASG